MTPRERAEQLARRLGFSHENHAIQIVAEEINNAISEEKTEVPDIHAHESAAIDAALLLTHIDALNSIKHVTACPENANLIDHCDAIVRERDKARAELRDEKQLVERIDELACKAIRERDEARSRSDTFQEECARLMRERDEARAILEQVKRGRDREVMDRNREIADRDRRIAELEAALRLAAEWTVNSLLVDAKVADQHREAMATIRAALSSPKSGDE